MKIATWNVNSVRRRATILETWLATNRPDALCLQETKVRDDEFPVGLFDECGYKIVFHGQPGYNGVAIASPHPLETVERSLTGFDEQGQTRLLAAQVLDVWIMSAYIPNGSPPGSAKYEYKLGWLNQFALALTRARAQHARVVAAGDYNVAPADCDVYDIDDWGRDSIAVSEPERRAYSRLLAAGYVDAHQVSEAEAPGFTWWDYRQDNYRFDRGLRIDHLLCAGVKPERCWVDRPTRSLAETSDHAPVLVQFD